MEKIICSCCGNEVAPKKFCPNCGAPLNINTTKQEKEKANVSSPSLTDQDFLNLMGAGNGFDAKIEDFLPKKIENTSVSDEGLMMLISSCKKTVATVGGDGYEEYVLYKRDEKTYELHYYSKYEPMKEEVHLAYRSDPSIAKEAFARIEELDLDSYENFPGEPMCGGIRILKYKKGTRYISLTTENFPYEKQSLIYEIGSIISKTADEEHRLK